MKKIAILILLSTGILFAGQKHTIVDVAIKAGTFNTLVKAVQVAGLDQTLIGEGPYTVFAPTDEAFSKLGPGVLEGLLEDKEALKSILLYHVVPGSLKSSDVLSKEKLTSAEGSIINVSTDKGGMINQSKITATDISASNGVIHVIDQVILPPEKSAAAASCGSKSSCSSKSKTA